MSQRSPESALGAVPAAALVAYTSGAVLVLEILSLRLVAPYIGLTLQTSTAVIGFALAAISTGAWVGGRMADRVAPQRLLGPTVLLGGTLVLFVGPVVRWTGQQLVGGDVSAVLLVAAVAVFAPAALLSAVTPMVVKLRLGTLSETGTIVGRLSGIATFGALVATFGTGFLLVAAMPTSLILLVLGATLVGTGLVLTLVQARMRLPAGLLVIAGVGAAAGLLAPSPCDVETAYHCARVVEDESRPTGRTLQLDTLSHSYVDLADPTYLRFTYIRGIASIVDALLPDDGLRALHIGGGGVTFPRYLAATRADTNNLVLEIDGGIVELDERRLGLRPGREIDVTVQDARVGISEEATASRDLVVGDAFAGLTVPWHLTTRETVAEIRRVLRPEGLYVVNVIDYPPLGFARAETATIRAVFPHVAVVSRPAVLARRDGGNLLILGSDRPLQGDVLRAALSERAPELDVLAGSQSVADFVDGAGILTDDFAPVDQLLTPYPGP